MTPETKRKILKWAVYLALVFLVTVVQMTPHALPEIFGARPVLLIPLGKVVEEEAQRIIGELGRTNITCLRGLPHPSGANARRLPQMRENGADLAEQVRRFGQKACPGQVHA